MPLDAEPTADGNVLLNRYPDPMHHGAWLVDAIVLGPLEAEVARHEGRTLYMPHHATCPRAADHRRR